MKSGSATAATAALMSAVKTFFPSGAFAQGAGPEVRGTKLGYIALTDASPLIIAKEKGFYAKHDLPDMEILKQASWGATRDNMALGTKANGIDGAHLLRPKVHLYTTGKVIQNNQPLPMYTLLNLNEDRNGPYPAGEQFQHFNPQWLHQRLQVLRRGRAAQDTRGCRNGSARLRPSQ
jgi:ABC-type nitrate/sulfonate/bicarbonate transport system substrate-binding protein